MDLSLVSEFLEEHFGDSRSQVLTLAGDASSRRYFRVVREPNTYVLMLWEPFFNPESYPFLNVQEHFKKAGVRVPEVLTFSAEKGIVLLEDLSDLTLERKFWESQNPDLVSPYYFLTIDQLIKIHFKATQDNSKSWVARNTTFNTRKFLWEMNLAREHVIQKIGKVRLSFSEEEDLQRIFFDICHRLDQQPKFICHRDFHSRNVMLKKAEVCIIDFQDARLGPIQYDLVSLLYDSYVRLSPHMREGILDYYLIQAKEYLPKDFSREQFDEMMKLQILQRCFKACGSFASFYNTRNDIRYLKYIQSTLKLVATTAEDFPQYKLFLSILKEEGLLEKSFDLT